MELEPKIAALSLVGKVYRKRDARREERILFVNESEFWHRFLDQKDTSWSDPHPYQMRSDGTFQLDWGDGAVFLCQFEPSSSSFMELNPQSIYWWEQYSDDQYSDKGSRSF